MNYVIFAGETRVQLRKHETELSKNVQMKAYLGSKSEDAGANKVGFSSSREMKLQGRRIDFMELLASPLNLIFDSIYETKVYLGLERESENQRQERMNGLRNAGLALLVMALLMGALNSSSQASKFGTMGVQVSHKSN